MVTLQIRSYSCLDRSKYLMSMENLNPNWTFLVLNLPLTKGDSKVQQHKDSPPVSVFRDRKEVKHHRKYQAMIKTEVGIPW